MQLKDIHPQNLFGSSVKGVDKISARHRRKSREEEMLFNLVASFSSLLLLLLALLTPDDGSAAALLNNLTTIDQHLASFIPTLSSESQVFLKSDVLFKNKTARWSLHDPPTYVVAFQPALESDVQKIVRCHSLLSVSLSLSLSLSLSHTPTCMQRKEKFVHFDRDETLLHLG